MSAQLLIFLHGALTLACFLVGVKFAKFWRSSHDRFFLWFVAAFWAFSVGWAIRAFGSASADHLHYVYIPRLCGFLLIIAGVIDKNKRAAR